MSDAAIMNIVTGMVTVATLVIGFLTLWIKLKYGVEKTEDAVRKIDDNTRITKSTTAAVESNARETASAVNIAALKADALADQLNGHLTEKITSIVKAHTDPITTILQDHVEQDNKNMEEIRHAIAEIKRR